MTIFYAPEFENLPTWRDRPQPQELGSPVIPPAATVYTYLMKSISSCLQDISLKYKCKYFRIKFLFHFISFIQDITEPTFETAVGWDMYVTGIQRTVQRILAGKLFQILIFWRPRDSRSL
jgi:hypothetical protein